MAVPSIAESPSTLTDEALRVRLRRSAKERMDAASPRSRAVAGQGVIESIAELQRRGARLWRGADDEDHHQPTLLIPAGWPAPRVPAFELVNVPAAS